MHIHIHIHSLLSYLRLIASMRFAGTMLLMLVLGQLQFAGINPVSDAFMPKAGQQDVKELSASETAAAQDRTDTVRADVPYECTYANIFHYPQPGIVVVPRMNRTPKPKSVYRCSIRAPSLEISLNDVIA